MSCAAGYGGLGGLETGLRLPSDGPAGTHGLPSFARLVDLVEMQSSGKDRYLRPMFGVSCFDTALAAAMQMAEGVGKGAGLLPLA